MHFMCALCGWAHRVPYPDVSGSAGAVGVCCFCGGAADVEVPAESCAAVPSGTRASGQLGVVVAAPKFCERVGVGSRKGDGDAR